MFASLSDLLHLVAVPLLAWAAHRDIETRRVPNWVWLPLAGIGVVGLVVDGWSLLALSVSQARVFFLRAVVNLGLVAPLGYACWRVGGVGGADAKAIITLALLFPTYPVVYLPWAVFPIHQSVLGVFSLTILLNTVLIGMGIPIALGALNAVNGRLTPAMCIGRPVPIETVTSVYDRLLHRSDLAGIACAGLDIDALRMYLCWRGASLDSLRSAPAAHRDPTSIPLIPNNPGDGSLSDYRTLSNSHLERSSRGHKSRLERPETPMLSCASEDSWGAAAFISDIDGDAYGTTPEQLRAGLELLCSDETESVWITPGIPFLAVVFLGFLTALTYGDLLWVITAVASM